MTAPSSQAAERRSWPRLPLAIPVFIRGTDESGTEFLEFTTAFNLSAGGMLVWLRHSLAKSARVVLEVPAAPIPQGGPPVASERSLPARLVRSVEGKGWRLCGFRFTRPLTVA